MGLVRFRGEMEHIVLSSGLLEQHHFKQNRALQYSYQETPTPC